MTIINTVILDIQSRVLDSNVENLIYVWNVKVKSFIYYTVCPP